MIDFSLKHILEDSPYDLTLSGSGFIFKTDYGIHYRVSFDKEDIVFGNCETYQQKHAEPNRFTICTAHAQIEDEVVYAAIIVDNKNPRVNEITADFERTSSMLADKP